MKAFQASENLPRNQEPLEGHKKGVGEILAHGIKGIVHKMATLPGEAMHEIVEKAGELKENIMEKGAELKENLLETGQHLKETILGKSEEAVESTDNKVILKRKWKLSDLGEANPEKYSRFQERVPAFVAGAQDKGWYKENEDLLKEQEFLREGGRWERDYEGRDRVWEGKDFKDKDFEDMELGGGEFREGGGILACSLTREGEGKLACSLTREGEGKLACSLTRDPKQSLGLGGRLTRDIPKQNLPPYEGRLTRDIPKEDLGLGARLTRDIPKRDIKARRLSEVDIQQQLEDLKFDQENRLKMQKNIEGIPFEGHDQI